MSVIVRGMEMPKNCAECERWSICKCLNDYEDYESILYAVEDGDLVKADGCPLVEIPTPHGRLIDADEFKDYIRSGYEEMKHLFNENLKAATLVTEGFCKDIDEAPTVIEAEE